MVTVTVSKELPPIWGAEELIAEMDGYPQHDVRAALIELVQEDVLAFLEGANWSVKLPCDEDVACQFADAIDRSPYDVSPCMVCGLPVVCLPDGMPMCEPCARKEGESE